MHYEHELFGGGLIKDGNEELTWIVVTCGKDMRWGRENSRRTIKTGNFEVRFW